MRTVVTGLGVVAPNGASTERFWQGLMAPASAPREPRSLAGAGSGVVAVEIEDESWLDRLSVPAKGLDRGAQLAVVAAGEALAMAGIDRTTIDPGRVAIVIGNSAGGQVSMDEQFHRLYRENLTRLHPMTIAKAMVSSPASWISIAYGFTGPAFVVSSACASGTHAVGLAAKLVESGVVDVAIAGGTEAPLARGTLRAWSSMRILAPDACRPFSRDRRGLVLGEGAGLLILERPEHAAARGARPLARLAGFSSCSDAGDIFQPDARGMARAMRETIADAGLSPADIGYVNAHGTGTIANDATETQGMKTVFGAGACPPISSIKGATGHGLGAAGGIEAVATVLALVHQTLPATANYLEPDPDCDLDYIPSRPRSATVSSALSNSFAFGGLNASLAFTTV